MAGYIYVSGRINEEVRGAVEKHLAEKFPQLDVSVDAARLEGRGIHVAGVALRLKDVSGPHGEIVYIDNMNVACDVSWPKLMQGTPCLEGFVLQRPRIRMVRLRDGSWNFDHLFQSSEQCSSDDVIDGHIENATVQVVDMLKTPPSVYTLRDLNLTVRRRPPSSASPETSQSANVANQDLPQRGSQPAVAGQPRSTILDVYGHGLGDHFRRANVQAAVDLCHHTWTARVQVDDLDISPELHASLPAAICQQVGELTLRARSNVSLTLAYNSRRENPWKFVSNITITEGRIDDRRLPYPLADLKADLQLSDAGLVVNQLSARYRQTTLRGRGSRTGWQPNSPCELEVEGRHVLLDPKLAQTFPELASVWNMLLPTGEVDIDAQVSFDGAAWQPRIKCTAIDCSFAYDDFPYRFERANGVIEVNGLDWTLNLTAYSNADLVSLRGSLHDFGKAAVGWVEGTGQQVRIEPGMIDALPPEARETVAAFHPTGQVSVFGRFWRDTAGEEMHQHIRMGLQRVAISHAKFPYRIENVQGVIEMIDDRWDFRDLLGSNDTGSISGQGTLQPTPEGRELTLHFQADQVPLDEELRDALPHGAQRVWRELKPVGAIHARAVLHIPPGQNEPECWVRMEPAGETVSVEPPCFPLKLEKLAGAIVFDRGELIIESIRAEHGSTIFSTRGQWQATKQGGGQLILRDFHADRLRFSRDVLKALPDELRKALVEVNPTGTINVEGMLAFTRGALPTDPLEADWDLNLFFHGNSVTPGIRLENLFGAVRVTGGYHGESLRCQGNLELDSVDYHGLQFTEVRGPLWLHEAGLWLGSPNAPRIDPAEFKHVTARIYDGLLLADGWVAPKNEQMQYSLRTSLRNADLAQFSQEAVSGSAGFSGKVDAECTLAGTSEGVRSLRGDGEVHLRDADIYELPQMVSLLKMLRLKRPSNTAFTQSDVKFHLEGDHVYLDEILFNGDAVSVEGQGEVGFNREIRLAFRATVAQGDRWLPVLREMIKGAAQQIVEIHVDGTLDKPEFRNAPFPGVGKALKQLQESTRPLPPLPGEAAGRRRPQQR